MITNIQQLHPELHPGQIMPSSADLELLATLLEPEDETYPWNIYDQSADAYFENLEQQIEEQCNWEDISSIGLESRSISFYETLDSLWGQLSNEAQQEYISYEKTVNYLQEVLKTILTISVPGNLINNIAKKVTEVFSLQKITNEKFNYGKSHYEKSTSEKLVECVQSLLPNLDTDDLLVLARPFAYSMRSQESSILITMINNLENDHRDWVSLSEIEQAKLSLALTDYAVQHLENIGNA